MWALSSPRLEAAWRKCPYIALALAAVATLSAAVENSQTQGLLEALSKVRLEADARALIQPHLGDLRKLDVGVVGEVVRRQWWDVAGEIVAKSHEQKVDLSFVVRKAVKKLKEETDELIRTLNPNYGRAQQVSPAFQWAQNNTCVFLTVKFTVRWNAPGALEVSDPSVNITRGWFNFSGFGAHSNNKYNYVLTVGLFDVLEPEMSSWSTASVGKLSATLKKRYPRKWPRLLAQKSKISNGQVWMDLQEKMDGSLKGLRAVQHSPRTCAHLGKLYCMPTDSCKKTDNCSLCIGRNIALEDQHICAGPPTEKVSLKFEDEDKEEGKLGGSLNISMRASEYDVDLYKVYWGSGPGLADRLAELGQIRPEGAETVFRIASGTAVPDDAKTLLVFSRNEYGECETPGSWDFQDAFFPRFPPQGLVFEDTDGRKSKVQGTVTVQRAANESYVTHYALYWGRSPTRRVGTSAYITLMTKKDDGDMTYTFSKGTQVPAGASHILAYSKGQHGENPTPFALKLLDAAAPCQARGEPGCPKKVTLSAADGLAMKESSSWFGLGGSSRQLAAEVQIVVEPAKKQESVTHYALYWGSQGCSPQGRTEAPERGPHIRNLTVGGPMSEILPKDLEVPPNGTHVLAFSANEHGESLLCRSAELKDAERKEEL